MLIVALGSGSLTLLGETIRSTLILVTAVWASVVLAEAERDAGRRYEFGVGKLEQAGKLMIALALAVAALLLARRAFGLIGVGTSEAGPLDLALAATANAAHTVRVGSSLWARSTTAKAREEQPASGVPSPVAASSFLSLLIVQTMLTVAALARDPAIALAADASGAIFVALLMMLAGVRMLWEAVLDLIDHPLRGEAEQAIAQLLLEQGIHAEELIGMRSRRAGRHLFVELTLDPSQANSVDDVRQRLARVQRSLEDRLDGLDLAIRLQVPEAEHGPRPAGRSGERR
jgi:divalent metal cation (Fe/Co/Zn/Cd) transporter